MGKYYVYLHRDLLGRVFYVGRGSGKRAFQTGNRGAAWKKYRDKHGLRIEFLDRGFGSKDAFDHEIYWIAHFRRMRHPLLNVSDGGAGVTVKKRWWYDKVSKALKGREAPKGYMSALFKNFCDLKQLEEDYKTMGTPAIAKKYGVSVSTVWDRLKQSGVQIREVGSHRKSIICIEDGLEFASVADAAEHYGVFRSNINKVIKGKYKHTGGKTFKFKTP
jgi:hypothetical protein